MSADHLETKSAPADAGDELRQRVVLIAADEVAGAVPEETATQNNTANTDKDAGRSQSTNGDGGGGGGEGITGGGQQTQQEARFDFVLHLLGLNVSLWVAEPNRRWPDGDEFIRPMGWTKLSAEGSVERLEAFVSGMAVCLNTGGAVVVVDVDPRNGGDVEKVRALLARLEVRIFAEVTTPGGGNHFYVAGHPDLPSVHSTTTNVRLPGFPGVDIQSFGCNVFLPFTVRPKYRGKGYEVVYDNLEALRADGKAEGAETLSRWVREQLAGRARKGASRKDKKDYFELPVAPRWTGGEPDKRQQTYLNAVLANAVAAVAGAERGGRNDTLFTQAMKCGSFIAGAGMDLDTVAGALQGAAVDCGLTDEDGEQAVLATIRSAFLVGMANPRAVPAEKAKADGDQRREIEWISLEDVEDAAPKWAWTYEGYGRIQIAALTLFGGRPGTGKSSAGRWFAARFSRGELEGEWKSKPQNVAYIAAEETAKYVLKPALRAAGADMSRIVTPRVRTAEAQFASLLAEKDERAMTDYLVRCHITVLVVDPVMATIKSETDIYRSNELREALAPWIRIAEAIDGIVIGIVHFIKGTTGDLVSSINGGSAFGEVARCVFGFAKSTPPCGEPLRVMTQGKNSCGREDLSLEYSIEGKWVTVSTGEKVQVGTFVLGGESDVSASELLTPCKGPRPLSPRAKQVLDHVNRQEGVVTPMDVFHAGLANDNKDAAQMLSRLYKRGEILNPQQGEYRRIPDPH